jgi:hypothetical protein
MWSLDIKEIFRISKMPWPQNKTHRSYLLTIKCSDVYVSMGSVYQIFGDFRMPVEYAMKLSRACLSNDECIVILMRLQNLHWSKLKYCNAIVSVESV